MKFWTKKNWFGPAEEVLLERPRGALERRGRGRELAVLVDAVGRAGHLQEGVLADDRVVALQDVLVERVEQAARARTDSRRRCGCRGRSGPRRDSRPASGPRPGRSCRRPGPPRAARSTGRRSPEVGKKGQRSRPRAAGGAGPPPRRRRAGRTASTAAAGRGRWAAVPRRIRGSPGPASTCPGSGRERSRPRDRPRGRGDGRPAGATSSAATGSGAGIGGRSAGSCADAARGRPQRTRPAVHPRNRPLVEEERSIAILLPRSRVERTVPRRDPSSSCLRGSPHTPSRRSGGPLAASTLRPTRSRNRRPDRTGCGGSSGSNDPIDRSGEGPVVLNLLVVADRDGLCGRSRRSPALIAGPPET